MCVCGGVCGGGGVCVWCVCVFAVDTERTDRAVRR